MNAKLNQNQTNLMEMMATLYYDAATNEATKAKYFGVINQHHSATVKNLVEKGLLTHSFHKSEYWLTEKGCEWAAEFCSKMATRDELNASHQTAMNMLASQFNSEYSEEYAHREDVTSDLLALDQLRIMGLVEMLADDKNFVRLTAKGIEMMGLTIAEPTAQEVALANELAKIIPVLESACDEMAAELGEGATVVVGSRVVQFGEFVAMPLMDIMTNEVSWSIQTKGGVGLKIDLPLDMAVSLLRGAVAQPVQQQQAQHKTAGGSDNPPAASPKKETAMNESNNTTNLVEVNMASEVATDLHANGINFDVVTPTELTVDGFTKVTSHFAESARSSVAWWEVDGQRANSRGEVLALLRAKGIKNRIEREVDNLAKAIEITGREVVISGNEVTVNGQSIQVIKYGFNPCYGVNNQKWTYRLDELFTFCGVDSLQGFNLYDPVEFDYNEYGVNEVGAVGVFVGFSFDWNYWRSIRTLKNVRPIIHVVSPGQMTGGGIVADISTMRPYCPNDSFPFKGAYRGERVNFRLIKGVKADLVELEGGEHVSLRDLGLHVK